MSPGRLFERRLFSMLAGEPAGQVREQVEGAMTQSISGKVILITGASSGIGRAMARLLAGEGAQLALSARSADKMQALAAEIGGNPLIIPADMTKPSEVDAMVEQAIGHYGKVDIFLANAGIYVPGEAVEGDPAAWEEMIAINVSAVFRAIRAVLPGMIAQKGGDIIVTSSISGHQAIHWEPVYSATKHAVQAFVHGVRRQVARHNLRIGSLAPGMVLNELWGYSDQASIDRDIAAHKGLRSEDVAEAALFMLTRPANVTIRDLVMLPQNQDI
jgi:ribitol 2-dehydrogenase